VQQRLALPFAPLFFFAKGMTGGAAALLPVQRIALPEGAERLRYKGHGTLNARDAIAWH